MLKQTFSVVCMVLVFAVLVDKALFELMLLLICCFTSTVNI